MKTETRPRWRKEKERYENIVYKMEGIKLMTQMMMQRPAGITGEEKEKETEWMKRRETGRDSKLSSEFYSAVASAIRSVKQRNGRATQNEV